MKKILKTAILLLTTLIISFFILVPKWRELLMVKNLCQKPQQQKQDLQFNTSTQLLLAIGILSKLSAVDRRDSMRYSWMKLCKANHMLVTCKFFTDSLENESKDNVLKYTFEEDKNEDLVFMPFKGGLNFGLRLYWMLKWFFDRYKFQYFLRIDDDYFLCLDRLLYELPKRPQVGLYWGFLHCVEHVVRIDEGWMILSYDVIKEAMHKFNTSLLCHPFGDQAVALWVKESTLNITYFNDERVIHAATAYQSEKYLKHNICEEYIALHGAYSTLMLKYWILYQENLAMKSPFQYEVPVIQPYGNYCRFSRDFDWKYFWPHVRYEPKLCKLNPTWHVTQVWEGREKLGHEAIY